MSLPFTTTVVAIEQRSAEGDRWETLTYSTLGSFDAIVSSPSPSDLSTRTSEQERIDMILHLNPGPAIDRHCRVTDAMDGNVYEVRWVVGRYGLGLDHVRCGLKRVSGVPE